MASASSAGDASMPTAPAAPITTVAKTVLFSPTIAKGDGADAESTWEDAEERRREIKARLEELTVPPPLEPQPVKPELERGESHRDFLIKEMAWMALDFETERKRHYILLKKRSKTVVSHFRGMEGRRRRREREDELAVKAVARKASRAVKAFWLKMDKFVAYKRRLEWQKSQRKAMDKHLVHLVKQTERYTDELATKLNTTEVPASSSKRADPSDSDDDAAGRLVAADLAARSLNVQRPYLLDAKVVLRPYQQAGLNWLVSMHERRLNGILADEMGLGKTLQTIALLAHLAGKRGIWGPHLVVVPTSCLVNWEGELKKFCPGLKICTYYGTAKRRRALRLGWSRPDAFHVCITSYQLAVQDAAAFRRKKFYYLVLDEAHNIKNFESRRWQTLLAFQAQRRLLLTGTPLQNSLMELWSLMHFLMPHVFKSRNEFSYWFANPLSSAVEGRSKVSEELVKRLHAIMRPFVLRRLKRDVEKELPGKTEHDVKCGLSRRQQLLYEEFMSRSATRTAMAKSQGNVVSMMNVVMQLRKVCNHPDLFEPRPVVAPLVLERLELQTPALAVLSLRRRRILPMEIDHLEAKLALGLSCAHLLIVEDINIKEEEWDPVELRLRLRREAARRRHARAVEGDYLMETRLGLCMGPRCEDAARRLLEGTPMVLAVKATRDNRARLEASDSLRSMVQDSSFDSRLLSLAEILKRFLLVVPGAIASPARFSYQKQQQPRYEEAVGELCSLMDPLAPVALALSVAFPDRSLVQWDSGKFHTLAPLLRKLKRGSHRCLIFTQMSKMLDVLESFLSFHGHSYVRLDGGTKPDDRQRLMDRFNEDISIFCFVLSTRSGGLGINLTGADTVIFYDSDWNPAMDAQAMDRAHRIGQTRDVHIYRLVCTGTIEENILLKARQKQKLELVAITDGKFDSEHLSRDDARAEAQAMALIEDEDDVKGARQAAEEAAQEGTEFSENNINKPEGEEVQEVVEEDEEKREEAQLEAEFAAWQERVGPDPNALSASLSKVEQHCLAMREAIVYTDIAFLSPAEKKLFEEQASADDSWDVDLIEQEKASAESRALESGELIATEVCFDGDDDSLAKSFERQRRAAKTAASRRRVTGAAWEQRADALTGFAFWYNADTGEATWITPAVILRRDADAAFRAGGYAVWPADVAAAIVGMLAAYPERARCASVCKAWMTACAEDRLVLRVAPVERLSDEEDVKRRTESLAAEKAQGLVSTAKRRRDDEDPSSSSSSSVVDEEEKENNFERTRCYSLRCALRRAQEGETIVLAPGHYWEDSADLIVDKRIRVLGDLMEPTRVVVELGGAIRWRASGGALAGLTLRRRPGRATTAALLRAEGKLGVRSVVVDNEGATGAAVIIDEGAFCYLEMSRLVGSVLVKPGGSAALKKNEFKNDRHAVLASTEATVVLADSDLGESKHASLVMLTGSAVLLQRCDCRGLAKPVLREKRAKFCASENLGFPDTNVKQKKRKKRKPEEEDTPPPIDDNNDPPPVAVSAVISKVTGKPKRPYRKKPKIAPPPTTEVLCANNNNTNGDYQHQPTDQPAPQPMMSDVTVVAAAPSNGAAPTPSPSPPSASL